MHQVIHWLTLVALTALPQLGSTGNVENIRDHGLVSEGVGWLQTDSRLFWTGTEGLEWRELRPVEGELVAVDFVSPLVGWAVAIPPGTTGDGVLTIARTRDGGATWEREPLSLSVADHPDLLASEFELNLVDATQGVLHVDHPSSSNFERWSEWRTTDGGTAWELMNSGGGYGSTADPSTARAAATKTLANGYAWERYDEGRCEASGTRRDCRSVSGVRVTRDNGRSWTELPLPKGAGGERQWTMAQALTGAAAGLGSRTSIAIGQGFDKCEIAELGQLLDWHANSPYSVVNLYIGGALAACSNHGLSAGYLRTLQSMGWVFIPTWVGPQSPCYQYSTIRISTDPGIAQGQGIAEADAAADTLARLGLTEADGTGSIVYYDMEYYNTSNEACNASVRAFVTGWTQRLHSRGHLAGVYGTGPMLKTLANLPEPPNAIWAAHWIYSSYDPGASVWNVYQLANDLWVNHQRLRQYTGGHNETWGTTTLNIDSNVLDGVVAVGGPVAEPLPIPAAQLYLPLMLWD